MSVLILYWLLSCMIQSMNISMRLYGTVIRHVQLNNLDRNLHFKTCILCIDPEHVKHFESYDNDMI